MVGKSEVTPFKQSDLDNYLKSQIPKIVKVHNKWKTNWKHNNPLLFVDGSAGNMVGEFTSPQMFLDSVFNIKTIPTFLYLIERSKSSQGVSNKDFEILKKNYQQKYKDRKPKNIRCILRKSTLERVIDNSINHHFPKNWNPSTFGLLYFDPNGFQVEPYLSIFNFCKIFPKVDIILNINTVQIKRNRGSSHSRHDKYNEWNLMKIIRMLKKEHIWVRDNSIISTKNKQGWLFLYASNWIGSKPDEKHFHHIDTLKGSKVIEKHNFSEKERRSV